MALKWTDSGPKWTGSGLEVDRSRAGPEVDRSEPARAHFQPTSSPLRPPIRAPTICKNVNYLDFVVVVARAQPTSGPLLSCVWSKCGVPGRVVSNGANLAHTAVFT
jgi:hypothetical protein